MSAAPSRTLSYVELLEKDFTVDELLSPSFGHQLMTGGQLNPSSTSSAIDASESSSTLAGSSSHRLDDLLLQPLGNNIDPYNSNQYNTVPQPPFIDPLFTPIQDFVLSAETMEALGPPADSNSALSNLDFSLNPYLPLFDESDRSFDNYSFGGTFSNNLPSTSSGTAPNSSFPMLDIIDTSLSNFPSLQDSLGSARYPPDQVDNLPPLGSSNSFSLFNQMENSMQPQHGISLSGGHNSTTLLSYTNMFANNANTGVDDSQHSQPNIISMTGHAAYANMPTMPPTLGALSFDRPPAVAYAPSLNTPWGQPFPPIASPSQTFPASHFDDVGKKSPSTPRLRRSLRKQPKPTSSSTRGRKRDPFIKIGNSDSEDDAVSDFASPSRKKWRKGKQLAPSEELWTRIGKSKWACHYAGPAQPEGCTAILASLRNLGRHMRENHACKEVEMDLPEKERVAFNSMPEGLLFIRVTCPYGGKDSDKCGYYRKYGRRWEIKTMMRKENVLRAHSKAYHRNSRRTKDIKKGTLADDESSD